MRKKLFQTFLCTALLSSSLFSFASMADWVKEEEKGKWLYENEDGSYASSQWIDWKGSRYYLGEDGYMVSNQTMTIDGTCYGFYGDGRAMHGYDITDVELSYVNLYSSSTTMRTASSKWARYSMDFPGNTIFTDYLELSGRTPIWEFLATIPGSGSHPLTVSSSYFQMDGSSENYEAVITEAYGKRNFQLLASSPVTLGNEETYQKLSLVYDPDGVYGRPIYRDCYMRKIGSYCHMLTLEYEHTGATLAAKIIDSVLPPV